MACLALRFSDLNTLPGWSREISAQARVPVSKLSGRSCHLAEKPSTSCPSLAPSQGPCPQLCHTLLLLTLSPLPSHCWMQDPGLEAESTLCKWGRASTEGRAGGVAVSEARRALGEGQCSACLRSWWSDQSLLLPAMECGACPGRYFGCTLSHPRPLELRPCTLHAITMTTTSNCFLAVGGRGSTLGKGGEPGGNTSSDNSPF